MTKALVDFHLKKLIKDKVFDSNIDLIKYVQPASIDLPVGNVAYLVKEKFLPFSKDVKTLVDKLMIEKIDLIEGGILFKGQTYLIPIAQINLPNNLYCKISPKSSIGRVDLMVRSVFDHLGLYDSILEGGCGKLWLEISPQSFNIKVRSGIALSQLRVFEKSLEDCDFSSDKFIFDENKKEIEHKFFDKNKFFLSLNVKENPLFGYEAKQTNDIIDLNQIKKYDWNNFFRKIELFKDDKFTLEKDKFYILATKENIRIPVKYSVEMIPFSHLIGELRAHYAGFFDPGFGGEFGATGVLEIRTHETLTIYDGQPICLMEVFENKEIPNQVYGESENNYHMQKGPKLAKYFK